MAQSEVLKLACSLLPAKNASIQRKFIDVPLVQFPSILQINKIQHSLAVKTLLLTKIDMAHGLNNDPHLAWRILTLYLDVEALRIPPDKGLNEDLIDEHTCVVS